MATLLVFEFGFPGPWGEEMARVLDGLALDIAKEPGLIWKVWTEAADRGVAGGVYLFDSVARAQTYTEKHSARLKDFGITDIDVRSYGVNESLSMATRGR